MIEKDRIFMEVILAIEAQRGDQAMHYPKRPAMEALDELEEDIRGIAKVIFGVSIPEPTE